MRSVSYFATKDRVRRLKKNYALNFNKDTLGYVMNHQAGIVRKLCFKSLLRLKIYFILGT